MFKEEYKKYYDEIHPSPELVERTKQMALEQYQSKPLEPETQMMKEEERKEESYETENIEYSKEEKILFGMGKGKIIQIASGFAAGIALITLGYLFSGTLRPERTSVGTIVENTLEPAGSNVPSSSPVILENETENKGNGNKEDSDKQNDDKSDRQSEQSANTLTALAKMGNADGVQLDYVSEDFVVFHGNFGILGYRLSSRQLVVKIPAEKYQFSDMWNVEQVMVNREGTKIAWYGLLSSSMERRVYDIATKTYSTMEFPDLEEENFDASVTISVLETGADVYRSKATDMCVKLSEDRTCQLIYQAPSLSLQASLGIAIVDMDTKTEEIYDVFGSIGKQVAQSYGVSYGGYHNEFGEEIFGLKPKETDTLEEETDLGAEPTEDVTVTETPVIMDSTLAPEPSENVAKPEETDTPQKITQNTDVGE